MTHAIVLITAERDAMVDLGGKLAAIDGVHEAYSVTGEWDFVAIVRVAAHDQLARTIAGTITQLPGIVKTQTMVAFEAFSQHDLDAMFNIGG